MKAESDPVLESAHELRVGWRCHGGQVAGSSFSVDGEKSTERELNSPAVAPRSNGVGEGDGLGAALHPDPGERVGHEPFTEPGIDGA
jgi:hypothetical protein